MSEEKLPKGWVQTTLGDVLPIQYGKGLVENSRDSDGRVPVYGSSGIIGFHNQALTSEATLIIGRKGSIGSIHYSPVPCWPIDTTYFAEASTNVDLRFFLYLLSSLGLDRLDKSTAVPGLSRDDYNAVMVKIAPLPEQHRIVAILEQHFTRLDAVVTTLQHNKAMLKRTRASVFKAAVEGKLTEAWRIEHPPTESASELLRHILIERRKKWEAEQLAKMEERGMVPKDDKWKEAYKEPVGPEVEELPELPEGWCWVKVEQVSHFVRYGSSAKTSNDSSGVPVLRMGNIQEGELDFHSLKYLPLDHPEFPDLLLDEDDLLFNRTNSAELVGKSAVYRGNFSRCSYASYLICLRTLAGCSAGYLCFFLNSSYGKEWAASVLTQQAGQANVNGTKLQALVFPLPPLPEQEQIVAEVEQRLSIISQLEAAIEASLKRIERLRQSILKKAFAGQLVPQYPNDEPAGALLERIREERKEREQEEQQRRKEERMKKAQNPGSVRAKKPGKQRTPLVQVLVEAKKPLPPDDLFRRAGLQQDVIEDVEVFFEETREAEGRQIKVTRPDTTQVFLEAVSE